VFESADERAICAMEDAMGEKNEIQAALENLAKEFSALIDGAKLKLKLASMDARDAAAKVGTELDTVRSKVIAAGERWRDLPSLSEEERLQLHLFQMELKERMSALEPTVSLLAKDAKEAFQSLPIEAARLEATLASMAAKDAVERRLDAATREAKEASRARTDAVDGLAKRAKERKDKLTR
jgi:hypothetical protein